MPASSGSDRSTKCVLPSTEASSWCKKGSHPLSPRPLSCHRHHLLTPPSDLAPVSSAPLYNVLRLSLSKLKSRTAVRA